MISNQSYVGTSKSIIIYKNLQIKAGKKKTLDIIFEVYFKLFVSFQVNT